MMNTLFNLVDACLYSDLIFYYENKSQDRNLGVMERMFSKNTDISYTNLFNDIRSAVDKIHANGQLKNKTIELIDQLVDKTPKLSILLDRLHKSGKKAFLLTNSYYDYTNNIMTHLLHGHNDNYPNWKDYFGN